MSSLVRGADFNAFGYDPYGHKAYVAAVLWGPDWIPPFPLKQFGGKPEPPRFGAPSRHQRRCLPQGWVPRSPPDLHLWGTIGPPFADPPECLKEGWCDGLLYSTRFLAAQTAGEDSATDISISDSESEEDDEMSLVDSDSEADEIQEDATNPPTEASALEVSMTDDEEEGAVKAEPDVAGEE